VLAGGPWICGESLPTAELGWLQAALAAYADCAVFNIAGQEHLD
jgi:hypothetical protein